MVERINRLDEKVDQLDGKIGATREEVSGLSSKVNEMHRWMRGWLDYDRKEIADQGRDLRDHDRSITRLRAWMGIIGTVAGIALGAWLSQYFGR